MPIKQPETSWAERKEQLYQLTHCRICGKKCTSGSGKIAHEKSCATARQAVSHAPVRVEIDWQSRKKVG